MPKPLLVSCGGIVGVARAVTACAVAVSVSRSSSSTVTLSVRSCLSRMTRTGTVVPGLVCDDHATRARRVRSPACR